VCVCVSMSACICLRVYVCLCAVAWSTVSLSHQNMSFIECANEHPDTRKSTHPHLHIHSYTHIHTSTHTFSPSRTPTPPSFPPPYHILSLTHRVVKRALELAPNDADTVIFLFPCRVTAFACEYTLKRNTTRMIHH